MRSLLWSSLLLLLVSAAPQARALSFTIDDFTVPQEVHGPEESGYPVRETVEGDMFSGSRIMSVGGSLPAGASNGRIADGVFTSSRTPDGTYSFVDLHWYLDEGSFDMTPYSAFQLTIGEHDFEDVIVIAVDSDYGVTWERTFQILMEPGELTIPFDELESPHGEIVDFSQVTGISLRLRSASTATVVGSFVLVPEPAAGLLVTTSIAALVWHRRRAS